MKLVLTSDLHYGADKHTHNKIENMFIEIMDEENPDAIILAGDIASSQQAEFEKCLSLIRDTVGDTVPLLLVRGNHDFWDASSPSDPKGGTRSLAMIFEEHRKLFAKLNIHHLEDGPYKVEDTIICGWDGWYSASYPATQDPKYVPMSHNGDSMAYLSKRAFDKFSDCLVDDLSSFKNKIVVTHHNPYQFGKAYMYVDPALVSANPSLLEEAKLHFDIMCAGHTHAEKDDVEDGLRILNCGSDYGDPKYKVFKSDYR